ncbi:MAG TPA: hypothetical protein VML55_09260 [Planctomycetaceae bacterium]|nr:hypothetical protein [Planctomycetaceae bacterium]
MRRFTAGLAVILCVTTTAAAQTFPYEAVVTSEAAVYSGPGQSGKFYETSRLERGASVVVHRHDLGGWHMIAPPPGSFSWIRAEHVKRIDANRGEVTERLPIVVRVGSSLDDSNHIEQVRLSQGDAVEILGEATLNTNTAPGPVRMYKIKPPRGEFRWIQGRHLAPADPALRQQHDRNPFIVPSNARSDFAGAGPGRQKTGINSGATPAPAPAPDDAGLPGFDRVIARESGAAVRRSGPGSDELAADRQRLQQLDDQFRQIIQRNVEAWDFSSLERDYRRLQAEASLPALASQVELRLQAIERYRLRKQQHQDVARVMSETSRRDAELLAIQTRQRTGAHAGPASSTSPSAASGRVPVHGDVWKPTARMEGRPTILPAQPPQPTYPLPGSYSTGIVPGGSLAPRPPAMNAPINARGTLAGAPRLDGAGIVQRAATTYPGAPRHVLLAPNGRVLSYLEAAPGLNLDAHVGQPMGVVGSRHNRPDLQSDLIIVHGLMPVRLVPAP